ncbi:hypothetical protein H0V99_03785 [Candidatus Saccharibacteria bacterium]|nr:hypothetical protein [Candidatus Saccharibacteria bacterium]
MDFTTRGGQQPAAPVATPQQPKTSKRFRDSRGMRIISSVLLVSVALLLAALAVFVATGGSNPQSNFIKKDKFQAVFLNGGQVYFGKIRNLNDKYLTMDNIYYLRVNEQVQPNTNTDANAAQQDISLAKLGCELHGPDDAMVINQDQVTFWENLKDDGQVVKAITEFVKANPDGQKCTEATT